jgi:hypothetical protein
MGGLEVTLGSSITAAILLLLHDEARVSVTTLHLGSVSVSNDASQAPGGSRVKSEGASLVYQF